MGNSEKRVNQTAHQRAMTNPEAREALSTLRANWNVLSPQQRVVQLKVLIGFGCSERGIAKDLGQPATTIRSYIKPASDWIADMEDAWAEDSQEQSTMSDGQVACRFPSKIPAKKIGGPVINETCPAQEPAHTSTVRQTREITSPLSTKVKESPVVNGAMSRQENQVGEDTPKRSLADAVMNRGQILANRMQRLAAISEQGSSRPNRTAGSMRRQGKTRAANRPSQTRVLSLGEPFDTPTAIASRDAHLSTVHCSHFSESAGSPVSWAPSPSPTCSTA